MCLGIPGQVESIDDAEQRLGTVNVAGVRRRVDLTCVAVEPLSQLLGQWVLVHVGFAMSVIDPLEAERTLAVLAALGEVAEELAAMQATEVSL